MASISLINPSGSLQNPTIDKLPVNKGSTNFLDSRINDALLSTSISERVEIGSPNEYEFGIITSYDNQAIVMGDISGESATRTTFTVDVQGDFFEMTGGLITSSTAGLPVSEKLRLRINGTFYKIQLLADTL